MADVEGSRKEADSRIKSMKKREAGKGDIVRPTDSEKYAEGWERVFGGSHGTGN